MLNSAARSRLLTATILRFQQERVVVVVVDIGKMGSWLIYDLCCICLSNKCHSTEEMCFSACPTLWASSVSKISFRHSLRFQIQVWMCTEREGKRLEESTNKTGMGSVGDSNNRARCEPQREGDATERLHNVDGKSRSIEQCRRDVYQRHPTETRTKAPDPGRKTCKPQSLAA